MRRNLRVHPAAEAELLAAAVFLNEQTSGAGDDLVVAVGTAIKKLIEHHGLVSLLPPNRRTQGFAGLV